MMWLKGGKVSNGTEIALTQLRNNVQLGLKNDPER
jgi:hypothetical protein